MKDYNLLIIDDEKSQRDILSGYLKKKGFNVFTAESGGDGIKMVNENVIDITKLKNKIWELWDDV